MYCSAGGYERAPELGESKRGIQGEQTRVGTGMMLRGRRGDSVSGSGTVESKSRGEESEASSGGVRGEMQHNDKAAATDKSGGRVSSYHVERDLPLHLHTITVLQLPNQTTSQVPPPPHHTSSDTSSHASAEKIKQSLYNHKTKEQPNMYSLHTKKSAKHYFSLM